jgi:DNA-binding transcriptional LysR family regulator
MEFRDIEYFAVLAEHGHVGRAAEALGLSQPALSLSLRRLELAMKTTLVKRTPKGVELTATGTALMRSVQRLRLAREDVLREVADLSQGKSGLLRVGAHPGVVSFPLAPACAELLKVATDLELEVMPMNFRLMPALRSGELDLIVHDAAAPQADLVQEHLFDDPFVYFVAANHHLARRKQVTIEDLAQERWTSGGITHNWDKLVEESRGAGNPAPRAGIRTTSPPLNHYLVATAGLVGTTTRSVFKEIASQYRFAEIRVKGWEQRARRVHVSYRKDGYLSPAGHRLIEILKAVARNATTAPKR